MRETAEITKVSNGYVVNYQSRTYCDEQKIFKTLAEVYEFLKEYYEEERS